MSTPKYEYRCPQCKRVRFYMDQMPVGGERAQNSEFLNDQGSVIPVPTGRCDACGATELFPRSVNVFLSADWSLKV